MKFGKYLLIPWLILAVHTILSVYNGTSGVVPYRELMNERQRILENLEKLQNINRELEGTMDALLYDPEAIRIRARELGYGTSGERFIRIVGLSGGRPAELRPGTIRTAIQPLLSGKSYRVISLCVGLLFFALFLAGDMFLNRVDSPDQKEPHLHSEF
ncbi:MAG: septum formation initiator family protein [Treponema sp.]|nr:septum formation initiator family protein [Treponema sp.]